MQLILCGNINTKQEKIAEYIGNQLRENHVANQLTWVEGVDPFADEKNVRSSE